MRVAVWGNWVFVFVRAGYVIFFVDYLPRGRIMGARTEG